MEEHAFSVSASTRRADGADLKVPSNSLNRHECEHASAEPPGSVLIKCSLSRCVAIASFNGKRFSLFGLGSQSTGDPRLLQREAPDSLVWQVKVSRYTDPPEAINKGILDWPQHRAAGSRLSRVTIGRHFSPQWGGTGSRLAWPPWNSAGHVIVPHQKLQDG